MAFPRRRFPHILPAALVAAVALAPVGCGGGDGVEKYTAPKATDAGRGGLAAEAGEYRLLGAMFPADDPVWFFKYNGPAAEVARYEADFDKLVASVRLSGNAPLEFTPPEGWVRGPGRAGIVVATVKTKDGKQEVTLTQSAGGVEQNLSRWVGQIGLRPGADDVAKYTKVIDAGNAKGRRVDLTGPKDPTTSRGPMMGGRP